MNNTPDRTEGMGATETEHSTVEVTDSKPMMVYEDADGGTHQEPPCPRCLEHFSFSDELRSLLRKILAFHFFAEKFMVDGWQDYSGMSGSSDYYGMEYIAANARAVKATPGMYGLHFDTLRVLRGSVHIALAAGFLTPEERALGTHLLTDLDRFGSHLYNDHRDAEKLRIDAITLETLRKPEYLGDIDPEWALRSASEFAGKSLDEIAELLRQQLKDRVEEFRSNVATVYDSPGRRGESATREEVDTALATIKQKANTWHDEVRTAEHCIQLLDVSCEVYGLTSKLDAWVAIDSLGERAGSYRDRIYEALERIPDLVDWDACENLKRLRGSVRAGNSAAGLDDKEKETVLVGGENND